MADAIVTFNDLLVEPRYFHVPLTNPIRDHADYIRRSWAAMQPGPLPDVQDPIETSVDAYVNCGRWMWACDCGQAMPAQPGQPTICVNCGEGWHTVNFPVNQADIEEELLKQPGYRSRSPVRHWMHGWTLEDLKDRTARAEALRRRGVRYITHLSIGMTRDWMPMEILGAANMRMHINTPIDQLAGRDGVIELEDSLKVLSGMQGNRYVGLPVGTTVQRPSSPETGWLRFNTTTNRVEVRNATQWATVGIPPTPTLIHRFGTSQTFQWPYEDLGRATILLYGQPIPIRTPSLDISLGTGTWHAAVGAGNTIWFVDRGASTAYAYNATTLAADTAKNIALGAGGWSSAVSDGTTLWFIRTTRGTDTAVAYTAATRAADSGKNFTLPNEGGFDPLTAASDGTTLWFAYGTRPVRAYSAATQNRDTSKDFDPTQSLSGAGVGDANHIWFFEASRHRMTAFAVSDQMDAPNFYFPSPVAALDGGGSAAGTFWLLDNLNDMAYGYIAPGSASAEVGGTTYSAGGIVTQSVSGLSLNDDIDITVSGGGFVEIYPQF